MMPHFFDIHSHLNDASFDPDRADVIAHMRRDDVWTITVGTDADMSRKACETTLLGEGIYASIGMHPSDNTKEAFREDLYRSLAAAYPKVVAIGECGLDLFRVPHEGLPEETARQRDLFERHLALAVSLDKPLMIHCRDAHAELLDILTSRKKEFGDALRGNIHFFAEGVETAKRYFDLDFTVSFTGVITFARQYDEVIAYAPLHNIMAETDAPYVAPVPYRGGRCEPIHVVEVVKRMAAIRGEDPGMVAHALVENAFRVFSIG